MAKLSASSRVSIANMLSEVAEQLAVSAYLVNNVSQLKDYLTMPKADKGREVADLMWTGFVHWADDKAPELSLSQDENTAEEVPSIIMEAFYDDVKFFNFSIYDYLMPSELPSHVYLDYEALVKNQWLVHFSDAAADIVRNGFTRGVSDITRLGLTTHMSETSKNEGGFGFAFQARDISNVTSGRSYGKHAVMFRGNGVLTYHISDEENQVIFLNSTAHDIVHLSNSDGWAVEGKNGATLFRSDSGAKGLARCVEWVQQNYDQYRSKLNYSEPGKQVGADFASRNLSKHQWHKFTAQELRDDPQLANEFVELIQKAYADIGGHAKITDAESFISEGDYAEAMDIDDDPDADIVMLIRTNPHGDKPVAIGHDGSELAKKQALESRVEGLRSGKTVIELSGAPAHILLTRFTGLPVVSNKDDVEKILNKKVEWVGKHPNGKYPDTDGWYRRNIGSASHLKILFGTPKF